MIRPAGASIFLLHPTLPTTAMDPSLPDFDDDDLDADDTEIDDADLDTSDLDLDLTKGLTGLDDDEDDLGFTGLDDEF